MFKAIKAKYQCFVLSHFQLSYHALKLRRFKGIHAGERCFIIGNGPSLSEKDLDVLEKLQIPCFGFNRIYLMFEKTKWKPKYYISQDELTLMNCTSEVSQMGIQIKFIPLALKYYHHIYIPKAFYFHLKPASNDMIEASEDISKYVCATTTVACTAIQFAVYMGFKEIYLLGVDHNFSQYKNSKGEIVTDSTVKDYFSENYNTDKQQLYIPSLDKSTSAFIKMKEYCDQHNIKVYNATRGGKLEVFPRLDFDEVIKGI